MPETRYSKDHEYVRVEGGEGIVGISDYAQQQLGDVVFAETPPIGKALKSERLEVLMGEGGVTECGKAGNCVQVCPKEIPLLESIAAVQRQATVHAVKRPM